MTEPLEAPLRDQLDARVDEATVQRLWRGTEARRGRTRARRRAWIAGGVAVTLGVAVAIVLATTHGGPGAAVAAGPLQIAGAVVPERLAGERTVRFDDGSVVELARGASLDVLENDAATFSLLLRDGRARFDVRPGGGRAWEIACGVATVRVLGTAFVLERSDGTLRVSVQRGAVLVRGERVPDGARVLHAGEAITVTVAVDAQRVVPAAPATPPTPALGVAEPPTPERAPRPRAAAAQPAAPETSWRTLAMDAKWDDAYASLGAGGVTAVSREASVDDLLLVADVCRLSHHADQAVAPLREAMAHEDDPRAGLAAFTLGRLELDRLGQPADAVADLERALALGLPRGLVADARQRLDEARARARAETPAP